MIAGIPWWVYMMIIFIFLSGYMAFRAISAEKKIEQRFIEREGRVYMNRINAERETKKSKKEQVSG